MTTIEQKETTRLVVNFFMVSNEYDYLVESKLDSSTSTFHVLHTANSSFLPFILSFTC